MTWLANFFNRDKYKEAEEVFKEECKNAGSDQPGRRSFGSDVDQALESASDQHVRESRERWPHKMVGEKVEKAVEKIYGRDNFRTNFDPINVDACAKEKALFFFIRGEEQKAFERFVENHKCKYDSNPFNAGAFGSNFEFSFRETTVGTVTKVKCNCGVEEDLTDYDCW